MHKFEHLLWTVCIPQIHILVTSPQGENMGETTGEDTEMQFSLWWRCHVQETAL